MPTITDTPTASNLRVVLVSPRNPLNIGAAARAMFNLGFSRLRLVNPYEVAFREARSAIGAHEILESAEEFPVGRRGSGRLRAGGGYHFASGTGVWRTRCTGSNRERR